MKMGGIVAIGTVILVCIAGIVAVALSLTTGAAKRRAPPPIKPVIIGSVEYRVPNTVESEGVVQAWDTNSQKLLWKRKIYSTAKLPSFLKETDVQLNFITNMIAGPAANELTIFDERGRRYILDTLSRKVGMR